MKHYSVRSVSPPDKLRPWLFFDVKFDIRDIRSRTSETMERGFQVQMLYLDEDLMWTPDMVIEREANFLEAHAQEIAPPAEFDNSVVNGRGVESRFLEYLLRHHKIVVHRNVAYDLYSTPSESPEDFHLRCLDHALESMSGDFRALYDRYLRRLWQLEDSMARSAEQLDTGEEKLSQVRLDLNRIFFELKEDISSLFMGLELADRKPRAVACDGIPKALDLDEKLSIFRKELYQELTELKQSHRQKAESIEPFQLPLTLHEVDVVGAAVLWQ